jgi:transcriptional regulator with XRE-family HTH domain
MAASKLAREIGERITEVRGDRLQNEFAKAIDVLPQNVSRWEWGECLPGVDMLLRICSKEKVSIAWLALGEGPKERAKLN